MRIIFLFLLFFSSIKARSDSIETDERLYRLDLKTKKCVSVVDPKIQRSPTAVEEFPHIDQNFVVTHKKICGGQLTCLNSSRLDLLNRRGVLPIGIESANGYATKFKNQSIRACTQIEFDGPIKRLTTLLTHLPGTSGMPIESKMTYDMVQETKAVTHQFIADSLSRMNELKNCLKLNVEYEKTTLDKQTKISLYHQDLKKNSSLQRGCEAIWNDKTELSSLLSVSLPRMRQALFAFNLAREEINPYDVVDEIAGKKPISKILQKSMNEPLKVDDQVFSNEFWKDKPMLLSPLSDEEKKSFALYLEDLKNNCRCKILDKDQQELLFKTQYNLAASENPMLLYFKSDKPGANELLSAFDKNQKLIKSGADLDIHDLDHLEFSVPLEKVFETQRPELIGDYCVLTDSMIQNRRQRAQEINSLLITALSISKASAIYFAKGWLLKTLALFSGAKVLGTVYALNSLHRLTEQYDKDLFLCENLSIQSARMCSTTSLEANAGQKKIPQAMLIVYGLQTSKMARILFPALIGGAALNED